MATIDEIARRAKVSKTTVSFVINSKPGVSPDTAAHVRRVMAEMNYVPSALAQRFASRKSMAIALITLPYPRVFRDPHHGEVLDAAYRTLEDHDYTLVLAASSERFLDEQRHVKLLRSGQVDGLLLLEPSLDQDYLTDLVRQDAPVVVINSDGSHLSVDYVRTDDFAVGKLAAEYLVDLGHRRIGFIAGPPNHASARDRLAGFRRTLEDLGCPLDEDRIFHGHYDTSAWSGRHGCREIITSWPDTTAILCCNDTMALGALGAAMEMRRPVPQNLSLIGVDDNPTNTCCQPQLTSIRQPSHELGKQAALLLLERIEGSKRAPGKPVARLLEPTLVVRDSCAPPAE